MQISPLKFSALTVGAFFLCFVLHWSYLQKIVDVPYKAEDQKTGNVVRFEGYLYDNAVSNEPIVLGTSLSAHAHDSSFVNLSSIGGSPLTGLSLLRHRKVLPTLVLVESNLLFSKIDEEVVGNLSSGLKESVIVLQERYRPMSLFLGVLTRKAPQGDPPLKVPLSSQVDPAIKSQKIKNQIDRFSEELDPQMVSESIDTIEEVLSDLEAKGIRVIFYESPIDQMLEGLVRHQQWRESMLEAFPNHKVQKLRISNTQTSDGIHLCAEGVREMREEFVRLALSIKG